MQTCPPILNRTAILKEAIRIADESGITSLSMRRLAENLGVKAMSLYNHVEDKEALITGMVNEVMLEIPTDCEESEWKAAMRYRACETYRVLLLHPWVTMELLSRLNTGPAVLTYFDSTLGCLVNAGFSIEDADHAMNAINSHIYGFTLQELNHPFEANEYADAAAHYIDQIPEDAFPYLNRLANSVINRQYDGIDSFEFGLDILLDGLDRLKSNRHRVSEGK
ncbi:MAG: TetR family transcriptional regulator [Oceanospirillaceae bacterium]|nr:TetR family transcriptional regulator [Oceanospirillaceae bacterium]